jgi:hypothetical protein
MGQATNKGRGGAGSCAIHQVCGVSRFRMKPYIQPLMEARPQSTQLEYA